MLNSGDRAEGPSETARLYDEAVRMFAARTPVVAAVQGAAIGGGLGVGPGAAMAGGGGGARSPAFRVASPETRFAANFARLGFHHGFGITVTLPEVVGRQAALDLLYTGRRVKGDEAHAIGLADRLVEADRLRDEATALARELAASAPLAVRSIRETMRGHLAEAARTATQREREEPERLSATEDFQEGVRAVAERRDP